MDKNILNAVAEVLKDERAKFDRQISELRERADEAVGNDADISELKSSIEFLFEEVDKKTDSIDFELAVMTKKESEDFLFQKIKEQTAALHDENASALDKIESAIKSLKDGADGADGSDGKDGADGTDGRDGIDNPAIAPIEIAPDHKAEKGLIVKHRGGLWQAIRNTNGDPEVDSGNWKCFVDGVAEVDITFNAKEGVYSFDVEKSNGERESLSIDRMPAYLPPSSDHKSVEGDYFLDGTSLNLYLDSEWVAVDLKGNRGDAGENGNRGRKGRDGVGISEIFVADGNLQILLTDGEVKDIYLDVLNSQPEDINQEIKRYAGIWHTSQSYQAGDVATMMGALYVCTSASSDSPESSDDWELMVAPAIGGAGGDGGTSGGAFPTYALVGESAPSSAGKKFSNFTDYSGSDPITGVGLDSNGHNIKFGLTTDAIQVNPNPFRNAKNGQFIGTPEELAALKNQRDVNEFLYGAISDIEAGDINLEGYATEDWVIDQLEGPTQDEKVAAIEAQIQFRGLMDLDADGKPTWPADQTKDRGGWWAYPSSKFANTWKYENLEWVFTKAGDVNDVAKAASPKYAVGDIIQMQINDNEAGAGTGFQYADTSAVFVEYKVEELYYPDRLNGNTNTDFPAYRVSKSLPDYRYAGSLPNVVKGMQGDPSDAWIQWYPTKFAFGAVAPEATDLTDVEERLECIEDAMPDAESVVAVPTGDLVLKITGSRPTGATGEAGKMLMWKAEAGSGGSPYNELKVPVDDVDAIDENATAIWFKQGDVVQKWNLQSGGWFTNVNVLHISTTSTEGDTLVDGLAVEMHYKDPTACFAEVISRQESKDDDRRLQAEIAELALGLETLLTQRTHGQWKYIGFSGDNIPRNAGEFALASDDLSAAENILTINLTDLNGTTVGLGDVDVGDYVEIVDLDEPENYALFTCTKKPEGTGISDVELALKDKGENFLVGETCEIRFFAVNEENINLAELDDRYLKLSGGTMANSAELAVNYIKPINLKHIQYSCDPSATHPEALVNRAMVQTMINAGGSQAPIPEWTLAHFSQGNMQAGKMAFCDGNLNGTNRLEAARGIVFSAIDANGNRVGRTKNGVDWERDLGGALNVLYDEEQTLLSMARSHGSAPAVIYYVAASDAYMIIWPAEKDAVVASNITHVVIDQNYKIHCPEIFF